MNTQQNNPKVQKKGGEPIMVQRSLQVDLEIWDQAKRKAARTAMPLSSIVRHLLKAWVEGKIQITINGDE
jgi:hypothetical protein